MVFQQFHFLPLFAFQVPLWTSLGPSWTSLGPSWRPLGPPWASLGPPWASSGVPLAASGGPRAPLGALLTPLGGHLGPSWGCCEPVQVHLVPSCAILELPDALRAPILDNFQIILGTISVRWDQLRHQMTFTRSKIFMHFLFVQIEEIRATRAKSNDKWIHR